MTLLLEDELFKDDREIMIDECSSFMLASTQTTAMHLFFSIYYLFRYPEYLEKVRAEVA